MKTVKWLSFLLYFAVACQQPLSPTKDIVVTVSVSSAIVRVGDTVKVHVIVTNQGSRDWIVNVDACPRPFEVAASSGAVVAPYGDLCSAVATALSALGPGKSWSTEFQWATDARPSPEVAPVVLPPGTYQLRGVAMVTGSRVMSEPVAITITIQ